MTRVEQHIRVNEGRWQVRQLSQQRAREVKIDHRWDLFQQGVHPGDTVTTKLVAFDCKGNRGESHPVAITIAAAGFERQRLEALAAERDLLKALRTWKTAEEALESKFLTARQSVEGNAAAPVRKAAVAAFAAATDEAATAVGAAQAQLASTLRVAAPGHETTNLVLLSRVLSYGNATLAYLPYFFQGASLEPVPPGLRELMGEANDVFFRTLQRARLSDDQYRRIVGAEEVDVIVENLQVIAREQERLVSLGENSGESAEKWAAVAARLKVVLTEVSATEETMKATLPNGADGMGERFLRLSRKLSDQRAACSLAAAAPIPGRELLAPVLNMEKTVGETWRTMLEIKRDLVHAPLHATTILHQEADPSWIGFEKLRQGIENAFHHEKIAPEGRATLASGMWDLQAALWKEYGDAEELRSDADAPFISDLRSLRLALDVMHDEALTPGETSRREPAARRLAALDQAYRVLEMAHELSQLAGSFDTLATNEHWQAGALRSRSSNVTAFAFAEHRYRALPNDLGRTNLSDPEARQAMTEASNRLYAVGGDAALRALLEEMPQRIHTDRDAVTMTEPAKQVAALVRHALEALRKPVVKARQVLAEAAPKLAERMAQLAQEAKEMQAAHEEKAAEAAEKKPEGGKADAQQHLAAQQALNQKVDTLKDAIRAAANLQNVLEKKGREQARDADDAVAMLKEPPVRAEQALAEAAQAERASEQKEGLQSAAKEDGKLAAALDQLAKHYDALEKGQPDQTRLALREAEKELGVKEQMDRDFANAEELAKLAGSTPEEMLAKLEKALPNNPLMRQELSSVSRDLLQDASKRLTAATAQESAVARDVDKLAAQQPPAPENAQPKPSNAPNTPSTPASTTSPNPAAPDASSPPAAAPNPAANPAPSPSANQPPAESSASPPAAAKQAGATPPAPPDAKQPVAATPAPAKTIPALAEGAKQQEQIAQGAGEAGAAVERAGRHEERLQNQTTGKELQKLGADVKATAQGEVPRAGEALAKAQAPKEAQSAVGAAEQGLKTELARLGDAQSQSPGPEAQSPAPAPAPAPPANAGQPTSSPTAATTPPAGASSPPASPGSTPPSAAAPSPAAGSPPPPSAAMATTPPSPGTPQTPPSNSTETPPTGETPDPATDSLLASTPAAPQQQVWMARALDSLDAALHADPASQSAAPEAGQPPAGQDKPGGEGKPNGAQPPGGQPKPGSPEAGQPSPKGQEPGQPGSTPPTDTSSQAMQQAQQALAAATQAAAAERRASRSPAAPGQPSSATSQSPAQAASKTGALAGTAGLVHGPLPAAAGDAAAARDWGKLPRQLAEQLSQGQRESVAAEYQKEVETYYRVIAERAKKGGK